LSAVFTVKAWEIFGDRCEDHGDVARDELEVYLRGDDDDVP
jgi:hypothetical protein